MAAHRTTDGSIDPVSNFITKPGPVVYRLGQEMIVSACNAHPIMKTICDTMSLPISELNLQSSKTALALTAEWDNPGAFDLSLFDCPYHMRVYHQLEDVYNVTYKRVASVDEFCHAIDHETATNGPIDLLIIRAHGNQHGIKLSDHNHIRVGDLLPPHSCLQNLPQGVSVVVDSCSTGKGGQGERNFANYLASQCPKGTRIFSSTVNCHGFILSQVYPIEARFHRDFQAKDEYTYKIGCDDDVCPHMLPKPDLWKETWTDEFHDLSSSRQTTVNVVETIMNAADEVLGVSAGIGQVKELKSMLITMLDEPANSPKILFNQLVREPERMWHKLTTLSDEVYTNGKVLLEDPTLSSALGAVGAIYTMINLVNDILPIIDKVKTVVGKCPLKAPLVITKELTKLMVVKVVSLVRLGHGLITDPVNTAIQVVKGAIRAPERLCNNVKKLIGGGHKRRRRRRALAHQQAYEQDIMSVFPGCYAVAKHNWLIPEEMGPQEYLTAVLEDWKMSDVQSLGDFLRIISMNIGDGHFRYVHQLSPRAHMAELNIPMVVAYALVGLARETLVLSCGIVDLERVIADYEVTLRQRDMIAHASVAAVKDLKSVLDSCESVRELGSRLKNSTKKSEALVLLL